jgi:hypothetical protein
VGDTRVIDRSSPDASRRAGFSEHAVVALRRDLLVDGRLLTAGTPATVVAAYRDGDGYEIEIFEPFHVVVTVEADHLAG